ncbi:hypothetical protein [Clostridium oryzae]|uniref:Uncharacterized protein n=1 Tax=Clostridium oryzae TaxID=1450648 RepID=A0A1V4IXA8_9CLOT|nr:hypothetical protein [Clostridium oryzae]OPJ64394.1 hypothetical protein CLORY_05880 [Clostridium oryzae]
MEINSLSASSINYSTSKTTKAKNESAEKVSESKKCSEDEKLNVFKQEIWKEIDSMPYNREAGISIQITDGAFKRMMKDSKFKDEMIDTLKRDAIATNNSLAGTTLTRIDENGYSGYSYCKENEAAFAAHSSNKDSFYSRKAVKKHDYEAESKKRELQRIYKKKMLDKEDYDNLTEKDLQAQKVYASKQYQKNIGVIDN